MSETRLREAEGGRQINPGILMTILKEFEHRCGKEKRTKRVKKSIGTEHGRR